MGVVYLGRDPVIGRMVALKTIRIAVDDEVEQKEFTERFLREAQAAGILSHPNIVAVHDVGEDPDTKCSFIAMEYVEGKNLKQLLGEKTPYSYKRVAEIIGQVAEALDYANKRGIVHRDVKPANIIITSEGVVKITDFGIAKMEASNLTATGQFLGTPNYMSPEQVTGETVDGRSDLFSLAVCLYELLTRKKPFLGDNLTSISYKIVHEAFTPPETYDASMPPEFTEILAKGLAKDPANRFQRGNDFALALYEFKAREEEREMLRDLGAMVAEAEKLGGPVSAVNVPRPPQSVPSGVVQAPSRPAPPPPLSPAAGGATEIFMLDRPDEPLRKPQPTEIMAPVSSSATEIPDWALDSTSRKKRPAKIEDVEASAPGAEIPPSPPPPAARPASSPYNSAGDGMTERIMINQPILPQGAPKPAPGFEPTMQMTGLPPAPPPPRPVPVAPVVPVPAPVVAAPVSLAPPPRSGGDFDENRPTEIISNPMRLAQMGAPKSPPPPPTVPSPFLPVGSVTGPTKLPASPPPSPAPPPRPPAPPTPLPSPFLSAQPVSSAAIPRPAAVPPPSAPRPPAPSSASVPRPSMLPETDLAPLPPPPPPAPAAARVEAPPSQSPFNPKLVAAVVGGLLLIVAIIVGVVVSRQSALKKQAEVEAEAANREQAERKALLDDGNRLAQEGKFEDALKKFRELLQRAPDSQGARDGMQKVEGLAAADAERRKKQKEIEDHMILAREANLATDDPKVLSEVEAVLGLDAENQEAKDLKALATERLSKKSADERRKADEAMAAAKKTATAAKRATPTPRPAVVVATAVPAAPPTPTPATTTIKVVYSATFARGLIMVGVGDKIVIRKDFDFGKGSSGGSVEGTASVPSGPGLVKLWVIASDRSVQAYSELKITIPGGEFRQYRMEVDGGKVTLR